MIFGKVEAKLSQCPREDGHVCRIFAVNILGSQKGALSLGVPKIYSKYWPDDDYESKHVATLIENKLVAF